MKERFKYSYGILNDYDTMPTYCNSFFGSTYTENNEIMMLEDIDGIEFNLVLGTTSRAFYPGYTSYVTVRESHINNDYVFVPINVQFTTAPPVEDAVRKSQGLKICPHKVQFDTLYGTSNGSYDINEAYDYLDTYQIVAENKGA